MPKQKPHKGLKKRVKVTARGKIKHKSSFSGHLMSQKAGTRKQQLRKKKVLAGKIADNCRRALCE